MSASVILEVGGGLRSSALLDLPPQARACCLLAHGAGTGMQHPFMDALAGGLAARGIAALRYQFPYLERGSRRPDPPPVCHATVRAAVAAAAHLAPGLPLFAGGRSFGARMTSQAQALAPLPGVRGLAFLGFPLHPAGRPGDARAAHLSAVAVPMLFVQGARDALADGAFLAALIARLGSRATLHVVADADHALHVPARTGRTAAAVMDELLQTIGTWIDGADTHGSPTSP